MGERRRTRAPPAETAAPVLRQSGPGCGRRHVLTRGHLRCPLSAPFSPRPSSPACAHRASIQWPQVVGRQGLRSLLTQATVSPDPFAMVRRLPGTHRALPGPWVFCCSHGKLHHLVSFGRLSPCGNRLCRLGQGASFRYRFRMQVCRLFMVHVEKEQE